MFIIVVIVLIIFIIVVVVVYVVFITNVALLLLLLSSSSLSASWLIIMFVFGIIGIELMAAAQALDIREFGNGTGVTKAHEVIREHVEFLDIDRPLYKDHNTMKELVKSGKILDAVEETIGSLE